jgi:hypothetical protein
MSENTYMVDKYLDGFRRSDHEHDVSDRGSMIVNSFSS